MADKDVLDLIVSKIEAKLNEWDDGKIESVAQLISQYYALVMSIKGICEGAIVVNLPTIEPACMPTTGEEE